MENLASLALGNLYLLPNEYAFSLTIELALTTGVNLLVCGNRLPFYDIAYELARRVGQRYESILREQIYFSRAETCIQLVDFLSELEHSPRPLFISDLLSRFQDEDERDIDTLFFACQLELQRLSQDALVFISATPRSPLERLGYALTRATTALEFSNTEVMKHGTDTTSSFLPI